jgi:A/G-specific adenine glycosylase
MLAAAKKMVADFNGHVPDSYQELCDLPGIGPYTAGAILSIAFNQPVAAIDGNVRRVISRVFALRRPLQDRVTQQKIQELIEKLLPANRPGSFNQALMDLGAGICMPEKPDCGKCPLHRLCKACLHHIQHKIPIKSKRPMLPHKHFTAAIIRKNNRILLRKRPPRGLLAGLWKFPGGEDKCSKSLAENLQKMIRSELGLSLSVGPELLTIAHRYTHFRLTLHVFKCSLIRGNPRVLEGTEWSWVQTDLLTNLAFSKADREIVRYLLGS